MAGMIDWNMWFSAFCWLMGLSGLLVWFASCDYVAPRKFRWSSSAKQNPTPLHVDTSLAEIWLQMLLHGSQQIMIGYELWRSIHWNFNSSHTDYCNKNNDNTIKKTWALKRLAHGVEPQKQTFDNSILCFNFLIPLKNDPLKKDEK